MRRMKGVLKAVGLVLGLVILFGASTASASGYPMGIIVNDDGSLGTGNIIVLGKFGSGFTSLSDANNAASVVAGAVSLLGFGSTIQVITPNQLAGADADVLKSGLKGIYKNYGFSVYVFLEIKRVTGVSPTFGNNIRIDVWIADAAALLGGIGLTVPSDASGFTYVTSIEVPEMYLSAL